MLVRYATGSLSLILKRCCESLDSEKLDLSQRSANAEGFTEYEIFLMGSTYELPTLDDLDRHPLISGLLALHMQVLAK